MPRTDHTASHLPGRYIRRLLRVYVEIDTLTAPCWIDGVLDHCPDGLAFSVQLANARNTLADLLEDLSIDVGGDAPGQGSRVEDALPVDFLRDQPQAHAVIAQGELPGLDVGQPHPEPGGAAASSYASRGGISESAGGVQ